MPCRVRRRGASLSGHRILLIDGNSESHADYRRLLAPDAPAAPGGDGPGESCRAAVESTQLGSDGVNLVREARASGHPFQLVFFDLNGADLLPSLDASRELLNHDADLQLVLYAPEGPEADHHIRTRVGASDRVLVLKKPFGSVDLVLLARSLQARWADGLRGLARGGGVEHAGYEHGAQTAAVLLHDPLTGLPNRTLFTDRLAAAIERQERHPELHFAVVFIDLDRFKLINDSLGHSVGDILLIEVARRIESCLRSSDRLSYESPPARLGGDEFLVLLEDLRGDHDAARVAERMLVRVSEPYLVAGHELRLTASIGIATSKRNYTVAGDMVRDANTAMSRAKEAGRGGYVLFGEQMHRAATARLSLENELRRAVDQQQLRLYYQPIIALADGRLAGFESLVRWEHPHYRALPISAIIAVAEETGLIHRLGLWVLEEACRQLTTWNTLFPELPDISVSVNLSRRQLIDPELPRRVAEVIMRGLREPRRLAFEITEGAVLQDPDASGDVLRALAAMGVKLHLDDFGTGYSAISCLHELPLHSLKIDRMFLSKICEQPKRAVVVEAIIAMARACDLEVVAEGVETAEQAELLRKLGCDFVQGFHVGRPVDAATAEAFMRARLAATPG